MAKFYKCPSNNLVVFGLSGDFEASKLEEIVPGSVDAAKEKHVPSISVEGDKVVVKVGEVEHPMADAHYIEWIAAEGDNGIKITYLKPGDKPETHFCNHHKWIRKVYAYCNLHGLWVTEL